MPDDESVTDQPYTASIEIIFKNFDGSFTVPKPPTKGSRNQRESIQLNQLEELKSSELVEGGDIIINIFCDTIIDRDN